jgi:tight adherence protein C
MRRAELEADEVASISSVVAIALRGGVNPIAALELALSGASGATAEALARTLKLIHLGAPTNEAFDEFRKSCRSTAAEEFAAKLQTAEQFGSGLADQLDELVETLRSQVAVADFAQATASETKMLLPLVFLILPVTVIFALYPSLQVLNLQMEGI